MKDEPGTTSGRELYGIGNQQIPQGMPNTRLAAYGTDGAAEYKIVTVNSPPYQASGDSGGGGSNSQIGQHRINMNMNSIVGVGEEPMKRKRGRPPKYGTDGTMSLTLTPTNSSPPPVQPTVFSPPPSISEAPAADSPSSLKKGRGRPPGSGKKQQMIALGLSGVGFTPHVIIVKAGEHSQGAICILSANGAISNVTLRQAAASGGTVTYEGRFEILSLSGSYLLSDSGGQRSRTGGLSISLAGPDGRVLGGGVAGLLTAASPVQVIVGSFSPDLRKESRLFNQSEPSFAPSNFPQGGAGATGTGSPQSTPSGGHCSPLHQSAGACDNNPGITNMPWK